MASNCSIRKNWRTAVRRGSEWTKRTGEGLWPGNWSKSRRGRKIIIIIIIIILVVAVVVVVVVVLVVVHIQGTIQVLRGLKLIQFLGASLWKRIQNSAKSKGKIHPRTGHEGPEGEQRYSSTLSLTSALDAGGWSTPRRGRFTSGDDPAPTVSGPFHSLGRCPCKTGTWS